MYMHMGNLRLDKLVQKQGIKTAEEKFRGDEQELMKQMFSLVAHHGRLMEEALPSLKIVCFWVT